MSVERPAKIKRIDINPGQRGYLRHQRVLAHSKDAQEQIGSLWGQESSKDYLTRPSVRSMAKKNRRTRQMERFSERQDEINRISSNINVLVSQQKEELQTSQIALMGHDAESVFASYLESSLYARTFKESCEQLQITEDKLDLRARFAGKIFEDIVYGLLSAASIPNSVLLSPERSLELTKMLFPGSREIVNPFGQNFIKRKGKVYNPDGYVINTQDENPKIDMVIESTLNNFKENLPIQYERFKSTKKAFPEVFSKNSQFVLVLPSGGTVQEMEWESDVKVIRVPFSATDFSDNFNVMWRTVMESKS